MEDFLQKAHFENLKERVKTIEQISFLLLPNNNNTKQYSCILPSLKNEIPLNMLLILEGGLAHLVKRIARAKSVQVIAAKVTISRKLFRDFSKSLRYLEGYLEKIPCKI